MIGAIGQYFRGLFGAAPKTRRVWLFYARPEAWLDASGERHFEEIMLWSCEKGTRVGDLALLYRISLDRVKVDEMISHLGMNRKVAKRLKASELGKDIPLIWKITSVRRRFLPCW